MLPAIAARLLALGIRVIVLPSCVVGGSDLLFYGQGFTVATCDSDFAIKMIQSPRLVAAEIESYILEYAKNNLV